MSTAEEISIELFGTLQEITTEMQSITAKIQRAKELQLKLNVLNKVPDLTIKCKCACGCEMNKKSMTRHLKTKKHADLMAKINPHAVVTVEAVEAIKPVVKYTSDSDSDEDEMGPYNKYITNKIEKYMDYFYKGKYVKNYDNYDYLDNSLRLGIANYMNENNVSEVNDRTLKHLVHQTLDDHLEIYPINDQAVSKEEYANSLMKSIKKKNIPVSYCMNEPNKLMSVFSARVYEQYADMKNRGVDIPLIKDHIQILIREAVDQHIVKHGFNTKGSQEYLLLKHEI
jgi:hypothetical protein